MARTSRKRSRNGFLTAREWSTRQMQISWVAIFLAALSSFLIGGIWYSPAIFGQAWQAGNGFDEAYLRKRKMPLVFIASFCLSLLMAVNLAAFLGRAGLRFDLLAALAVGIGWVGPAMGVTYLFERRAAKLFLINAGYHVVSLAVMGLIIGALQH